MHLRRKEPKMKQIFAFCFVVVVLLLPGCIGQEEEEIALATDPDTLVIGWDTSSAVTFDPVQAYEFITCAHVFTMYDQLVTFQGTDLTRVYPELAESWSKSADGKTWTFKLRQGVKFASGNPVTADDVVWSLRRVLQLDLQASWVITQFGMTVDTIQKLDDTTVSIGLDGTYADFLVLSCLAFSSGSIIDSKLAMEHEQTTDTFPDGDMGNTWLVDHSAGSGPFVLDHWSKLEEIVMVRNDNWAFGKAGVQKIFVKDVPEPSTQMMQLQEGDIDIAYNLLPDQVNELKGTSGIRIQSTIQFALRYLGMNMVNFEPFTDEKVRDAVKWALDYDGIVDDVMGGGGVKGQSLIPYGMFGHNPSMPFYRNPARAKELLAEAGYPTGFDVEMLCSNVPPWTELAVKVQSDLAEVGIRVKVTQMVAAEMYQIYRQQNHELILAGWGVDYPDPDGQAKAFAHVDSLGTDAKVRQIAWRNMQLNPELAILVDAAAQEGDQATRISMYMEIQEIVTDWGATAIMFYPIVLQGVRTWVEGYEIGPMFWGGDLYPIYKERVAA